ncbi:MAG TPA: [acyl-carrier-protein] S-malonyltransferase [Desulfurivibrio alkaliphilus]|uniref:Malonyl CoA-acyl carrier protein transacylase n=1 Tax=Desulfurivibrio alkaliphilus TaxID=427923 RepID=A0A7C2TH11_9BACT|nr:[acyl-carrier-protein] S-malonyltransferase [Desulfurivibrio alkaliphilus]
MSDPAKTAIIFPGQGSQYIGMGRGFLEQDSQARELLVRAEKLSGLPLERLCLEGPLEELTRTLNLQPALTVINLICLRAVQKSGVRADYYAGHSLGEYSALAAAGVLSFDDTIRLVTERGRLMEREAARNPGAMAAVVKLDFAAVAEIVAAAASRGRITIANHNSAAQIVISGDTPAVEAASALAKERGGKAIALPVSGAWHSELIAGAVPDFSKIMAATPFNPPATPLFFNVTAAPETDPAAIRSIMARQIAATVRWYEIIENLRAAGVGTFIEVGPKTVLSGLLKKIIPTDYPCEIRQVDSPETLAAG